MKQNKCERNTIKLN